MGRWKTTPWETTTAETEHGRRGQEAQVSGNRFRGGWRERDGLGESDDASEGYSGGNKGNSAESETEEDRMTAGSRN